jgi:hypothetical protein
MLHPTPRTIKQRRKPTPLVGRKTSRRQAREAHILFAPSDRDDVGPVRSHRLLTISAFYGRLIVLECVRARVRQL